MGNISNIFFNNMGIIVNTIPTLPAAGVGHGMQCPLRMVNKSPTFHKLGRLSECSSDAKGLLLVPIGIPSASAKHHLNLCISTITTTAALYCLTTTSKKKNRQGVPMIVEFIFGTDNSKYDFLNSRGNVHNNPNRGNEPDYLHEIEEINNPVIARDRELNGTYGKPDKNGKY